MIKSSEIQKKARTAKVRDTQIEKDYILSWLLRGIAQHEHLAGMLVFKGGTVLKRVYFEGYRFSEDLDFTLINGPIGNEQMVGWFKEVFAYIEEEANIPLSIIDENGIAEDEDGINFYIGYVGPLGGSGANKSVKIDISKSEQLEHEPVMKDAIIGYSDLDKHQLLCYPLEEVLVEKLRSVMQRMQPRDFYDIWYLLENENMDVRYHLNEFRNKCKTKKEDPTQFRKKLAKRIPLYKARWAKSMSEQIKELPEFDKVEREVQRHLRDVDFESLAD